MYPYVVPSSETAALLQPSSLLETGFLIMLETNSFWGETEPLALLDPKLVKTYSTALERICCISYSKHLAAG
ncbi:hypothetical protein CCR75_003477 [Bremia lactucae]|uniref:Uncharacterized protein n=1 Tax=Bremia lactucae TaxID=4779 RepID=A0A976FK97_BRELC|nr:hypothetical protein CCR75_003477 [Bremia lactucae]